MKNIAIIGATISGNRGAEAMLSTVIGHVMEQDPKVLFHIFSYYPDEDRKLCTTQNINIFSATPAYLLLVLVPLSIVLGFFQIVRLNFLKVIFPKSVRALGASDVLIDIAGVSFMDGRVKFIPYNILTIFPAMMMRTPVVKFAQALGTFKNFLIYLSAKIFLRGCTKIFARGRTTEANLKALHLPEDIVAPAADLAFLHKSAYTLSTENPDYVSSLAEKLKTVHENGKKIIGLCPSAVIAANARKENWNYIQLLAEIVNGLSQNGFAILLYPNATRENSRKLRNNDLPVIDQTARYLAVFNQYPEDLLIVTKDVNTAGIKTMMAYCDVNIISRFHAMIASVSLCKPLVVMGWGHKYQEVMDEFSLGEYVFDYKNNTAADLLHKVDTAVENTEAIQEKITIQLPTAKKSSSKQFEYLFGLLKNNS